ncbi:MAG: 50S ribosomal protein L27 [Candidatus Liptonbacteria bacterium]|nr:50S ribosomal protein L27 [Candidatus Liptonbacteria bacterium]
MAHTKAGGSTKLGRDSIGKRLGLKRADGQFVSTGEILVRQRGTKYFPGENVKKASDDTLFAVKSGIVRFVSKKRVRFDSSVRFVTKVMVVPK